ncbi:hypothetical protein [Desertibaculum subflavum]
MDKTSLLLLGLFGVAATFLVLAGIIGVQQWRARREAARRRSLASTF